MTLLEECKTYSTFERMKFMLDLKHTPKNDFACLSYSDIVRPIILSNMFMERCIYKCMKSNKKH